MRYHDQASGGSTKCPTGMVARYHTSPRLDDNNQCIAKGLRGSVPGQTHKRTLNTGGIQFSSHKCSGAKSSSICCESLHSQSKAASCLPENGQQDSSCLLVKDGGTRSPPLLGVIETKRTIVRYHFATLRDFRLT